MSESWWIDQKEFKSRLPVEQKRMRVEEPHRGTSAYLQALEEWERLEGLNHFSPRTRSLTPYRSTTIKHTQNGDSTMNPILSLMEGFNGEI